MIDLSVGSDDSLRWGAVVGASLLAAVWDVRTGTIPNRLTGPLLLAGLAFSLCQSGWSGLGESLLTCLLLAAPFVLLFAFAGGGAGDAKLMGALGAWLPMQAGVVVLVAVVLSGGVVAMLRVLAHRRRKLLLARIGAVIYVGMIALCSGRRGWTLLRRNPEEAKEMQTAGLMMPYGLAIFIGVCIGAMWVKTWTE